MDAECRHKAVEKLAFFGMAGVLGSPAYRAPSLTIGQAMYNINAFPGIPDADRRKTLDEIVSTGLDVNTPLRRLAGAGIGALAGNTISRAFGASPFVRGLATAIGANYGYSK